MTPTELFVVLLALAFIGGVRAARGSSNSLSFSSGVEYVVLGLAVGPKLLGFVTRGAVEGFDALLLMGLGWLLAVRGANFGRTSGLHLSWQRVFASIGLSILSCGCVFVAVFFLARRLHLPHPQLLALGLSAVCTESSAPVASDPKLRSADKWTSGTELVPILLLSAMVVSEHLPSIPVSPPVLHVSLSVGLGLLLGGIVTALLGTHFEHAELWPVLLGAVLLVVGTALRLDLPAVSPAFLLGLTVSLFSSHRDEVRRLMNGTERQVLLPCLLLAGVLLQWPDSASRWLLVAVALLCRLVLKAVFGLLVAKLSGAPLKGAARSLQRSSSFSIAMGLVVFLRQSDDVGQATLTAAVLSVLLGDLISFHWRSEPASESASVQPDVLAEAEHAG